MKYSSKALLDRYRELSGKEVPKYLLIGVRNGAHAPDAFDDKFYLFVDGQFVGLSTGTTHPGKPQLMGGWKEYSKFGSAILKSDEVYHDVYMKSDGKSVRHHNGKLLCFRQVRPMKYYRDGNSDAVVDESGKIYEGNFSTNFHLNSYNIWNRIVSKVIGNWSAGCQVPNDAAAYRKIMDAVPTGVPITYALFKEF